MTKLLSTKEVAQFLRVNEKMVYTLVAEKGLPATKLTGKWMFPRHLVEQWVEINTLNYPKTTVSSTIGARLLVIAGSNDLLLSDTISCFNQRFSDHVAVFGNLGSMGGVRALRQNQCHIATSHLMQNDEQDYNFEFAESELENLPAVVNFCRREQGLLLAPGNPKQIETVANLAKTGIRIVNRSPGTGTRLLLDHELDKAGITADRIDGYDRELPGHLEVGLEVLAGRADAAPGIHIVAHLLGLDFIPWRWERFDLLITKERFFEKPVQQFLGLLQEEVFKKRYPPDSGYDLRMAGKVVFPGE
jgi:putative molybdopterin biosynthesis protein